MSVVESIASPSPVPPAASVPLLASGFSIETTISTSYLGRRNGSELECRQSCSLIYVYVEYVQWKVKAKTKTRNSMQNPISGRIIKINGSLD